MKGEREIERRESSGRCGSRIVCVREAGGLLWIRGRERGWGLVFSWRIRGLRERELRGVIRGKGKEGC